MYEREYTTPSPYQLKANIASGLEAGILPVAGNGYSFVIDQRPAGEEDNYIPAAEFTRYFSERQIPIADEGHRLRDHDIGHVPSYQNMFAHKCVADTVQVAAVNALSTPESCEAFTKAIDGLGDAMRNIQDDEFYDGAVFIGDVNGAYCALLSLVELATPHVTGSILAPERQAKIQELKDVLLIDHYRHVSVLQRHPLDEIHELGGGHSAPGAIRFDKLSYTPLQKDVTKFAASAGVQALIDQFALEGYLES